MKTLIIDRVEGIYAICRDAKEQRKEKGQKLFGIQLSELPAGAAVGDIISVDDDAGTISLVKVKSQLMAKK
jgi:hypothetical protein